MSLLILSSSSLAVWEADDCKAAPLTCSPLPVATLRCRNTSGKPYCPSPKVLLIIASLPFLRTGVAPVNSPAPLIKPPAPRTAAGPHQVRGSDTTSPAKPNTVFKAGFIFSGSVSWNLSSSLPIQPRPAPVKKPSDGVRSTPPKGLYLERYIAPPITDSFAPTLRACIGRSSNAT